MWVNKALDPPSLFFITPGELAAALGRLCANLRLITLDLRFDMHARAMRVVASWPPGTAPDTSTEHPGVLLFLPENVDVRTGQPDDLMRQGPIIHLPVVGLAGLVAPRTLIGCHVQVHNPELTPTMRMLGDHLRRGLASDLIAPTWRWDLAEPRQTAMAHPGFRHSPNARTLYKAGWSWRQLGEEGVGYGPCSPP